MTTAPAPEPTDRPAARFAARPGTRPDARADARTAALTALRAALDERPGFKTRLLRSDDAHGPFLCVTGVGAPSVGNLTENIRCRTDADGTVVFVWSWDEDVAGRGDVREAARAIGRVLRVRM
ncbi:hypothetical protein [Actinomadura atramentaria]|uniref:hypothetical protein n=1 Tax=Actinomadura atramentaria TaxID=1990 RepID=UPI00036B6D4E|nr:hypothetical protein [Actinomadura atramentaria]